MAGYNLTRYVEELLEEQEASPPSFTVHLYPEHWTLNNGSKFMYNNPVASLLDDIRAQRIPVDFLELFDAAKVPFYQGCMIVELLDYRPPKGKDPVLEQPDRTRVVLTPSPETLWADLCLLNQQTGNKWTDRETLEVESRILLATAPPLCLDPDPHLTRIANNILKASVPTTPISLKRKAAAMEQEEDETERARRAKIMQFMNPKNNRSSGPSYRILDTLQRMKTQKSQPPSTATASVAPVAPPAATAPTPAPAPVPTPAPVTVASTVVNAAPVNGVPPAPSIAASHPTPTVTPAVRSTPAPAPVPTPTPPIRVPSVAPDLKKKGKGSESGQSPATPRPPSTIPAHLQSHTQVGRNSPVPSQPSHTPRPPSVAGTTRSPVQRPPSVAQPVQAHPPPPPQRAQPSPAQQIPTQNTQPQAAAQSAPAFQAVTPHLQAPAIAKKKTNLHPQPQPMSQQQYQMMMQHPYYQQMNQARMAQSTPNPGAVPAAQTAGQSTPARNSPMVAAQTIASRSPMPQNPQQAALAAQQQSYGYSTMQMQYGTQMRPMAHPQYHMVPGNAAGGQQIQPGQQPQEQPPVPQVMAQYPPMYPMNYQIGPVGQNRFWPVGRGIPVVNGQHPMPGMPPHPQQMALGAGKVPGGMQGS